MKISGMLSKKEVSSEDTRKKSLAMECSELTERLADIRANFDNVTDAASIEALIYEENAVLCRLEQLYRAARSEGITVELYERTKK